MSDDWGHRDGSSSARSGSETHSSGSDHDRDDDDEDNDDDTVENDPDVASARARLNKLVEARRAREDKRQRLLGKLRTAEAEESEDALFFVLIAVFAVVVGIGVAMVFVHAPDGSNGAGGGHGRQRRGAHGRRMPQLDETVVDVSVGMAALFSGTSRVVRYQKQAICPSRSECDSPEYCGGHRVQEQIRRDFFSGRVERTYFCRWTEKREVDIPAGFGEGEHVVVEGAGNVQPGALPGDLVVRIGEYSHPTYTRKGFDLHAKMSVSMREALLGFRRELQSLDNRDIIVASPAGKVVQPGEVLMVAGEGFPRKNGGQRGDLHVKVHVEFPPDRRLTREMREAVAQAFS